MHPNALKAKQEPIDYLNNFVKDGPMSGTDGHLFHRGTP